MTKSRRCCMSCCTVYLCFCLLLLEVSCLVVTLLYAFYGFGAQPEVTTVQLSLKVVLIMFTVQFLVGVMLACLSVVCCCFAVVVWTELNSISSTYTDSWRDNENDSFRARSLSESQLSMSGFLRNRTTLPGYTPYVEGRYHTLSNPPSYAQFGDSQ